MEEIEASEHRTILGSYDDSFTNRLGMDAQRYFDGLCEFPSTGGQDKPRK